MLSISLIKIVQRCAGFAGAFCITATVLAAAPDWAWIAGSKEYDAAGVYGTKGVAAPDNTPIGRERAGTWTDQEGNLWVYGGIGYRSDTAIGYRDDLWKYDTHNRQWTWMAGSGPESTNVEPVYGVKGVAAPGNNPGSRAEMYTWVDATGNLWLLGGLAPGFPNLRNDLWKYDIATGMWTWVGGDSENNQTGVYGMPGIAAPENKPGARYGGEAWVDNDGNFWLYGGTGYGVSDVFYTELDDVWKFDPGTGLWTFLKGQDTTLKIYASYGVKGVPAESNTPGSRVGAASWTDPEGNLWMYGGFGEGGPMSLYDYLPDVWKYDVTTNMWTWMDGPISDEVNPVYGTQGVPSDGNSPGLRYLSAAAGDASGNLWMFGGHGRATYNDLWHYNITTGMWTWLRGSDEPFYLKHGIYGTKGVASPENNPGSREGGAAWFDNTGDFYLMGGRGLAANSVGVMSDLWQLDFPNLTAGVEFAAAWAQPVSNCKTGASGTRCKVKGNLILTNTGTADAGRFLVRFFLSSDAQLDANDVELKPKSVKKLKAGAARNLKVKVKSDEQTRGKFLIAVIDDGNAVEEVLETNNVAAGDPLP